MHFDTPTPQRRKPSLTPMIDVVFLLLVFFMLASQFGLDQVIRLPLAGASSDAKYTGPPRLIQIGTDDLTLNGVPTTLETLAADIGDLVEKPTDPIILRAQTAATTQNVLDVLVTLQTAGFETVVLIE